MKISFIGSQGLRGTAITAECISGLKPKTRNGGYLRLASDLRYEAKRAALGFVVDEVKGIPPGEDYGSYHEKGLKTDAAYRAKYAAEMFATADKVEAHGRLGKAPTNDNEPPAKGVATTIRDPYTGKPISVRRALDDTPLNRARYASTDPISDIQWLAGTMYEADMIGEAPYNGNTAIIAANGVFRMQDEDVQSHTQIHFMTANNNECEDGSDADLVFSIDPFTDRPVDHAADTHFAAWRFAKVSHGLTAVERQSARRWIVEHKTPNMSMFKELLDKLVSLYSSHDDRFAFDVFRHNSTTLGDSGVVEANDNRSPHRRRRRA